MPVGSFQKIEGLLLRQRGQLIVELESGGRWRLSCDEDVDTLIGCRVRVLGVKSDFDTVEASRITAEEAPA